MKGRIHRALLRLNHKRHKLLCRVFGHEWTAYHFKGMQYAGAQIHERNCLLCREIELKMKHDD